MDRRVKVHLDTFFTDYRSLCYVYVNGNMKTIQDLMDHISRKFDIPSTVYLTSNNVYLPPFEDIRILGDCDPIVVRPLVSKQMSKKKKVKCHEPAVEEDGSNNCNDDIGNYRLEHPECMSVDGSEGVDCTDSAPKFKKKRKKEKSTSKTTLESKNGPSQEPINPLELTVPNSTILHQPLKPTIVKEVGYSSISSTPNWGPPITNLSTGFRTPISITPSLKESKPIRVGEAVVAEFARRKKVDLLPISTAPNVVKSIIVSDQGSSNLDTDTVCNVSSSSESESSKETCEIPETKRRKRKRVRKRKPKPPLTPFAFCSPPVLNGSSSPHLHIRFEKESEAVENAPASGEHVENVDKTQMVNYKDLCENEIKNFPIMKGVDPKVDDIIAFKRFMLSESYTPEISNYIIGSVCSYSPSTSTVFVKVLEGREQCNDPRGKFYMEENEDGVQCSPLQQYMWSELIEPRLLFP